MSIRMPMLIGARGGIGASTCPHLMRFDAPPPTGARPTPTMKPLPDSMRPKETDPTYTPYPLPTRDATFEYGPTRMRNVPDVHRARLEEQARSASKNTVFADDVVDSESLFDMLEDEDIPTATPQPQKEAPHAKTERPAFEEPVVEEEYVDPIESARLELVEGIRGRRLETARSDLKRQVTDVPERYISKTTRLSEMSECVRPLDELLTIYQQTFYREDQDHIHCATLADLVNTVHRQSDEELCKMLYSISSMFDLERTIGSFFKRLHMHDAAFGDPNGAAKISVQLFLSYVHFIRTLEEYLLEEAPERLEKVEVLNALLTMYSHLRFRDLTSWASPSDDYQVHSLKSGNTGRGTVVFHLGEALYGAVMYNVASSSFAIKDPSEEASWLIRMLGGVVSADTKNPDGAAANALLRRIATLPLTLAQSEQVWLTCTASKILIPEIEEKVISTLQNNRKEHPDEQLFGVTCLSDVGLIALSKNASATTAGDEASRWKWHCDEIRATVTTVTHEHNAAMEMAKQLPNRAEMEADLWRELVRVSLAVRESITSLPLPFVLPLCTELSLDAFLLAPLHGFQGVVSVSPQIKNNNEGGDSLVADSGFASRMLAMRSGANAPSPIAPFRSPLTSNDALKKCTQIRLLHSSILTSVGDVQGVGVLNALLREIMASQATAVIITTSTLLEVNRQANMNPNFKIRKMAREVLHTIAAFGASMPHSNLFITPISDELLAKGDCTIEEQPDGSIKVVQHGRLPLSEGQSMWLTRRWLEDHGAPNSKVDMGIDKTHHDANFGRVMGQAAGSSPASQDVGFMMVASRMRNFRGGTKFSASMPALAKGAAVSEVVYNPTESGSGQRGGWHDDKLEADNLLKAQRLVLDKKTTVRSYSTKKIRHWGNKDGGARDKVQIGGERLGYGLAVGSPDMRIAGLGFMTPEYPVLDERLLKANNPILSGKRWDVEAKENAAMADENWGL